ncbi:MAG: hypothetical protein ABI076_01155, partial [Acidobacteriaceae bacterium]
FFLSLLLCERVHLFAVSPRPEIGSRISRVPEKQSGSPAARVLFLYDRPALRKVRTCFIFLRNGLHDGLGTTYTLEKAAVMGRNVDDVRVMMTAW